MVQSKQKQGSSHSSIEKIDFNNFDVTVRIRNSVGLKNWLAAASRNEGKPIGYLSINFCSDKALLKINKKYLKHDFFTDIITFDLGSDSALFGDIYISIERVKENAASLGYAYSHELSRVMIHGILHLCGHKDKTHKDQEKMRKAENYYLSLLHQ